MSIVALALAVVTIATSAPRGVSLADTVKTKTRDTVSKAKQTVKPQRPQVISPNERQRHNLENL